MKTHDFSARRWGWDCFVLDVVDGGAEIRISGWGRGVKKGDFLILANQGTTTRYSVKEIEYQRDPADQFFGRAAFAPRTSPEATR